MAQDVVVSSKKSERILRLLVQWEKAVLPAQMMRSQIYSVMNYIIALSTRNLWEGTICNSFLNYHREDLHTLLELGGTGTLLLGEFRCDSGQKVVDNEMRVPLRDFSPYAVKACIIYITGGSDLCLFGTGQIALGLIEPFNRHTGVIFGATVWKEKLQNVHHHYRA
jgi:hypothetical protein